MIFTGLPLIITMLKQPSWRAAQPQPQPPVAAKIAKAAH